MWIDDSLLEKFREPIAVAVWVPKTSSVVLGSSNDPQVECDLEACRIDAVPVLRRYGGGGTVVLYSGCIIVSVGMWVRQHYQNGHYFRLCNQTVIDAMKSLSPKLEGLSQAGISDLVWVASDGTIKKFGGTSLFRSRNYLLYQASIIVDLDVQLISRYLRHPSKEPDYRAGRRHADFLMGLSSIDSALGNAGVAAAAAEVQLRLPRVIQSVFGPEAILPCPEQFDALNSRLQRAK